MKVNIYHTWMVWGKSDPKLKDVLVTSRKGHELNHVVCVFLVLKSWIRKGYSSDLLESLSMVVLGGTPSEVRING